MPTMDDYMVIGVDTHATWIGTTGPFAVGERNQNVKDVQDSVAEDIATRKPHIIYSVVLKEDFYAFHRSTLANLLGA